MNISILCVHKDTTTLLPVCKFYRELNIVSHCLSVNFTDSCLPACKYTILYFFVHSVHVVNGRNEMGI